MNLEQIKKLIKNLGKGDYKDGSSTKQGFTYHPIPFQEFRDIPSHKPEVVYESNLVIGDIRKQGLTGTLVDIGCANGLYLFQLYLVFKSLLGYEGDKRAFDVTRAIIDYKGIDNITVLNQYFDDNEARLIENYDICLMMNVHMWIHKQTGPDRCIDLLKIIAKKFKIMYFQTSHSESRGMYVVKELQNKQDIRSYLERCGFRVDHIGENVHGRKIRHLFRCYGS